MTFSMMTLNIMTLCVTIKNRDNWNNAAGHYAEPRSLCSVSHFFIVILNVIMLNVVMLSVVAPQFVLTSC